MITSKLTSKSQTTIPRPVRSALRLQPGDRIVYIIESDRVVLRRGQAEAEAGDDPFATFSEWHSEADQQAYGDL